MKRYKFTKIIKGIKFNFDLDLRPRVIIALVLELGFLVWLILEFLFLVWLILEFL